MLLPPGVAVNCTVDAATLDLTPLREDAGRRGQVRPTNHVLPHSTGTVLVPADAFSRAVNRGSLVHARPGVKPTFVTVPVVDAWVTATSGGLSYDATRCVCSEIH